MIRTGTNQYWHIPYFSDLPEGPKRNGEYMQFKEICLSHGGIFCSPMPGSKRSTTRMSPGYVFGTHEAARAALDEIKEIKEIDE